MLSRAVMFGYSAYDWKTIATSRRSGVMWVTSTSSKKMRPDVASSMPASSFSRVLLPEPDGPSTQVNRPSLNVTVVSASASLCKPR